MNWNEVLNLPLGTKVRLPFWDEDRYIYKSVDPRGYIHFRNESTPANKECRVLIYYIMQESWEFFEDKTQCDHLQVESKK